MTTLQRDSAPISVLKAVVTGTTLFIAGGMASTSLQFVPSLVAAAQKAPARSKSNRMESGRLTPQPSAQKENKAFNLTAPGMDLRPTSSMGTNGSDVSGYKVAANQFVAMSKTAFATQVPPELLTIIASGFLTYNSYRHRLSTPSTVISSTSMVAAWQKWAAVAALVVFVFPLTGGFMVPIDHKIARIAGAEEKIEPYEDAPLDTDAERTNTVEFLGKWNTLNMVRSAVMLVAGGIGLWGSSE